MRELGNLAVVCAKRSDVLLCIQHGNVRLYVGEGPNRRAMCAAWRDDKRIEKMIHMLNFGEYAEKTTEDSV